MRSAILWREKLSLLFGLGNGNKSASLAGVYSETPYRELIRREAKRSERSGHLYRILLVYRSNAQGVIVPLEDKLARKTSLLLSRSCRDTDYIGWYRHGRIMGVLLTDLLPDSANYGCEKLKSRLLASLRDAQTVTDDDSLEVRMLEPGELTVFNASEDPASSQSSKD